MKRMDEILWKLDELGEVLNELDASLQEIGPLTDIPEERTIQEWVRTATTQFNGLYWTLEHLKRDLETWKEQRILSVVSKAESVDDIAALLLRKMYGLFGTCCGRVSKSNGKDDYRRLLIASSPSARQSPFPTSDQGTSSFITPESAAMGIATPTSESPSETDSELMR